MKKELIAFLFTQSLVLTGAYAIAAESPVGPEPLPGNVALGAIAVGGSGCSNANVTLAPSADGKRVIVTLRSLEAEVGGAAGKSLDRKSCGIALPINKLARGNRARITAVNVLGELDLVAGAKLTLSQEAFRAGSHGRKAVAVYAATGAARKGAIRLRNTSKDAVTPCGRPGVLRLQTDLLLQKTGARSVPASLGAVRELRLELGLETCRR